MHRKNIRIALVYTGTLILAPLAWLPFSYSGDFSKLRITGLILAAGSLWTLMPMLYFRTRSQNRSHMRTVTLNS
ncbi:MAG: hypothetical protein U9P42_05395 [Candidatus Fermentibacteria bacterium]|nr:hypothetical protein [Candidatus Fermentibacteria bacterium]